jgi:hypothetical protein
MKIYFLAAVVFIALTVLSACTISIAVETSAADTTDPGQSSETAEKTGQEPAETPETTIESSAEAEEEKLEEALFGFFEAVEKNEEYSYFSNATKDMVGTEEEYKSGDKTDIYFIIQESHSSWENVAITNIKINGKRATVTFTGDREVEGMVSEGEELSFNFVKENGQWKIDFS